MLGFFITLDQLYLKKKKKKDVIRMHHVLPTPIYWPKSLDDDNDGDEYIMYVLFVEK